MSISQESTPGAQPYLNVKIDADGNGTIDTTLSYLHTPIPLNDWTVVDTLEQQRHRCGRLVLPVQHSGDLPGRGPDLDPGAGPASRRCCVFQNSTGFPRSLIFSAGQTATAAGETVRGAVDRLIWGLGDAVVSNDFEPALISVADATAAEPGAGTAFAEVEVSLSVPTGSDPRMHRGPADVANLSRWTTRPTAGPLPPAKTTHPSPAPSPLIRPIPRPPSQ